MLLENKVVYISGATSGIGAATVLTCLREGAKVVFTGRREEAAKEVLNQIEDEGLDLASVKYLQCDITKEEVQKSIIQTIHHFGSLYGVFANAGRHMVGNVVETTLEQWRSMFAVDVEGVFLTLKYSIPYLQKNGSGSIVLMGSDQCLVGKGSSSAYGAAKGAIGQLTKSTAIDYAKDKIRVNCVCPGTIDTPLARGAMKGFADKHFGGNFQKGYEFLEKAQPIQRLGTPEEVAELVTFMLSDKSAFMSGALVTIDGAYTAQ